MPASAAFHFAAQGSLLKYQIAPSGSVTATADSAVGIEAGAWQIVSTYNSVPADWVLSAATKTSVSVTAPSGSGKSAILQYTVNGGGPTDPRTGQPSNGDLIKTAKLYSGSETIVPGETIEGSAAYGWADRVNQTIYRVSVDGSGEVTVVGASVVKLDVTSTSGKVSFCEADAEHIKLENLAGQSTLTAVGSMYLTAASYINVSANGAAYFTGFSGVTVNGYTTIDLQSSATTRCYVDANGTRLTGNVRLDSDISPASLTGDVTDYNPTGLLTSTRVRIDPGAAARVVNSLAAGTDGQRLCLLNISGTSGRTLTLLHDDGATGTAAQRFLCPNNTSVVLQNNGAIEIEYDGTSSRWRVLAI